MEVGGGFWEVVLHDGLSDIVDVAVVSDKAHIPEEFAVFAGFVGNVLDNFITLWDGLDRVIEGLPEHVRYGSNVAEGPH